MPVQKKIVNLKFILILMMDLTKLGLFLAPVLAQFFEKSRITWGQRPSRQRSRSGWRKDIARTLVDVSKLSSH